MGLGMGHAGYGMGAGLGYHGMRGMGGMGMGGMGMGHPQEVEREDHPGVVAEISVTPGALTTAVVDNLDFDDLNDLAGRGVVICTDVTYDFDWEATCDEPYFSCCSLSYDNKGTSIMGDM